MSTAVVHISNLDILKAVVLPIATALAGFYVGRRNKKWDRTLALYDQFNAPDMVKLRSELFNFLAAHKSLNINDRDAHIDFAEDFNRLWTVMYFYVKIYRLIENDQLMNSLIVPLFGEPFMFWFNFYFSHHEGNFDEYKAIGKLNEWIDERVNLPYHSRLYGFKRRAEKYFDYTREDYNLPKWRRAGLDARSDGKDPDAGEYWRNYRG